MTSGDPDEILKGRRVVTSRAMGNKSNSVEVKNILEVKKGLCLFELTELRKKIRLDQSQNFTLELIAGQGESLPKAVKTWSEWLDCKIQTKD